MKKLLKKATLIALSTGLLTAAHAGSDDTLNFGIISTESSSNLKPMWLPFLADMSEELGVEVKPFFASDYAGIIEGMRFGKVDVAWFGNKSGMEAVDRSNGEIFAKTVAADGSKGYYSVLITHQDSALNTLQDVLNKRSQITFGNGDPNSTSGFLVPSYYVFALNDASPKDFKRSLNANHATNAYSVATKKVDVATNNTESLDRFAKTSPDKANQIKVIWKSPLIPLDPIVWNKKEVSADMKAKIKNFFMTYGTQDAAEKEILLNLDWAPFESADNSHLLPVRQLSTFKNLAKVKKDPSLSDAERKQKVAELEAVLADLQQQMKAKK